MLTTIPNNILGEKICAFSNVKVYLDSNFILRLLDLQDGYFTKQTQELYESVIAEGVCLKVFDKTVDEIKSVILYRGRQYFDNGYNRNPTAHLATGVIGAIARKKLTWPQIQALVDDMEAWLYCLSAKRREAPRNSKANTCKFQIAYVSEKAQIIAIQIKSPYQPKQ